MNRLLNRWWATALLLVAAASSVSAEPETSPPVPLYTPPLKTPLEAGGTGLAPEVTVRVTLDARGKVSSVGIEAIQPSSELDDLFKEVVEDTLKRWRYFPAQREGVGVETTLSWMVQFPSIAARDEEPGPLAWRSQADEKKTDRVRQRILSLPTEQRVKFLEEQATRARDVLNPDHLTSFSSQRFTVFTDAPTKDLARTLASNLEATFNTLHELIGQNIEPQPEPYRVIVFMYASKANFARVRNLGDWASGFYNPLGMLAFHMQMPSNEALLGVMLHEATHAYVDRYLSKPGVLFPRWLDEGFAEYVGNSTINKGQLVPGKTRKTEVYRTQQMAVRGKAMARYSVIDVRKAMRQNKALTIDELISADIQEFYGERRNLYYPESWLLVHFLHHGGEGWAEEKFPRLMLYVAEGYPPREAFQQVYGDPGDHEQAFRDYVKKF